MRFFYFLISFFIFNFSLNASETSFNTENQDLTWKELHVEPFLKRSFDSTSLFIILGGTTSVVLTNRQDDHIQGQWVNYQKMSESTSQVGDILGSGLAGVSILATQYKFDENQNHWMSHARSLVYSTIVSSSMKVMFGRQRPGNSQSHHSFPSGHTTSAFATATAMTYAYGWKAAVISYPLAIFVGISRLTDNAHWGSDVVAGAFVGFWTARSSSYDLESISTKSMIKNSDQASWIPLISSEQTSLTYLYRY